jgi:phage baseplate assembly protein V
MAVREIVELVARVADLERRVSGLVRHGTVAEVDPARQRVRLDFGPAHGAEGRFLSPWLPYAQFSGALRVHTPPTLGQQFTAVSPSGDPQQAVAVPLTHHAGNPSPSNAGDENTITYGNVRMTLADDLVHVDVGRAMLQMTDGLIELALGASAIRMTAGEITLTTPKFTGVQS